MSPTSGFVKHPKDPQRFQETSSVANYLTTLPDPLSTISFTLSLLTIFLMFLLFLGTLWSLFSIRRILLLLWSHLSFLSANPFPPLWLFLRRTLPVLSFAGAWSRILFHKKVKKFLLFLVFIIKS